ncbi:signal peptidase I [Candidatus Roizmanbacteria bacterium RIFCSPHIGHO2_01_FULL_38_15]|nr:MAG: signal peptidase I [Candidatus Roizmanbacteria bacterium RIFCSPHIGHO2_01_FULL_38_15]
MRIAKAIIEFVMEILETIVFVGSLFIVVYLFVVQPNQIKGASMEPTFYDGNYIFTSKVTYKLRKPVRGDVVVFYAPRNPELEYIKRIIGLPGDTVMVQDREVYVNNVKLNEPYISDKTEIIMSGVIKEGEPIVIEPDHYFVMGDNRPRSSDSREFGPISSSAIVGQVFYRYFPVNLMGPIKNDYDKSVTLIQFYKTFVARLDSFGGNESVKNLL